MFGSICHSCPHKCEADTCIHTATVRNTRFSPINNFKCGTLAFTNKNHCLKPFQFIWDYINLEHSNIISFWCLYLCWLLWGNMNE